MLIRFAGSGIHISSGSGSWILRNTIGLDSNGQKRANEIGVSIGKNASGNVVGDPTGGQNTISGNSQSGVLINGSHNRISANYIGVSTSGKAAAVGNGSDGVAIVGTGANENVIGGDSVSLRNIISQNGANGVTIWQGPTGNKLQFNYIGIDADGAKAANTRSGVEILQASGNWIGYTSEVDGQGVIIEPANVISANTQHGIHIELGSKNKVGGNFIGTGKGGTTALGNTEHGVFIDSGADNEIGGFAAELRNVISANGGVGVRVAGQATAGTSVFRNNLGTNKYSSKAAGDALGNGSHGVHVLGGASGTIILRNQIGNNGGAAVRRDGAGPGTIDSENEKFNNTMEGAAIFGATDAVVSENDIYGNGQGGVYIAADSAQVSLSLNSIHHHGGVGLTVAGGSGHVIADNTILDNAVRDMIFAGGVTRADGILGIAGTVTQNGGDLFIDSLEFEALLTVKFEYMLLAGNLSIESDGELAVTGTGDPLSGMFYQRGGNHYINFGELYVQNDYHLDAGLAHWLYGDIGIDDRLDLNGGLMKLGISTLTTLGGTWINSGGILEAYYGNLYGDVTNDGLDLR